MNVLVGPREATSSPWARRMAASLFGGEEYTETAATTIPELLEALQVYGSRSEARRAGREGEIPLGYSELRASKKVPRLCVWRTTGPKPRSREEIAQFKAFLREERRWAMKKKKGGKGC